MVVGITVVDVLPPPQATVVVVVEVVVVAAVGVVGVVAVTKGIRFFLTF